ncbi:MAG: tetratricopeptide repeat protein [Bacteroidales bacterium]|nr:tetratricopeptide repeat protein [Bacteroidales bacterium]
MTKTKNNINTENSNFILKNNKFFIYSILFLLSFLIYGNTITHNYALDDAIVIADNSFTQQGFAGVKDILTHDSFTGFFGKDKKLVAGGRYRPLSIVTFAVEHQFFGKNPHLSHFINILLYALIGILIFVILSGLLTKYHNNKWYLSIPFLTVLLFIAHPIHTEVVANIKGRDEIMALLFSLLALYFTIKYFEKDKSRNLFYSFLSLFLALMSKENSITFVLIIPLTIYFFTEKKFKKIALSIIPLIFATVFFLIIRHSVIGNSLSKAPTELMNNPFLHATFAQKYATIFYTLGLYIKLLIFPHPLTFDYYPKQITIINWIDLRAIIPLVFYSFIFVYSLLKMKRKNIIAYSIFYFLITFSIVSNIVFPVGTFMNERFMFMPSIGFCLIMAYFLFYLIPKHIKNKKFLAIFSPLLLVVILSLYSFKTIDRNKAWKNDFVLFTTDVKTSTNSAKSNCSAGGKLIEKAQKTGDKKIRDEYLKLSIKYLQKSLEIYPNYNDALLLLGNAYFEYNKDYDKTIFYYKRILNRNPNYENVYNNISVIFSKLDSVDYKIKVYNELYKINQNRYDINYNLGLLYSRFKMNYVKAIPYFQRAVKINPEKAQAYKDLGVVYGLLHEFKKSAQVLQIAAKLDKKDPQVFYNLGITYRALGDKNKADKYFEKAKEFKKLK